MYKITVFIIETGEPSIDDCLQKVMNQSYNNLVIKKISNIFPMWRAFQCMLDECETDWFVQVDADMLLEPFAVETLHKRITSQKANTAISVGWLWDNDVERQILGVKIYNHNICVNFPYTDSLSCEMTQVANMKKHGFVVDVMDMPAEQSECLGLHFPSQTPEMAFRRWERNMIKMRKLKWMDWLKIYPQRLFFKMLENPSDEIIRAKLFGVVSGLSLNDISDSEADYSKINNNFMRYDEFFGSLTFEQIQTNLIGSNNSHSQKTLNSDSKLTTKRVYVSSTSILDNELILTFADLYENNKYIALQSCDTVLDDTDNSIKMYVDLVIADKKDQDTKYRFISAKDIAKEINKAHPNILANVIQRESDDDIAKTHFWDHLDSSFLIINSLSGHQKNKCSVAKQLKKSLIFAIDIYGWAFDNISSQVLRDTKHSSHIYKTEYHFLHFLMRCMDIETNVICFWWKSIPLIRESSPKSNLIPLLFDHYSWVNDDGEFEECFNSAQTIGVGNIQLETELRNRTNVDNIFVLKDGVDFDLFPLSARDQEPFVFGWVGNSNIQVSGGYSGGDLKGVGLIKSATTKANVKLHILDVTSQEKVPQSKMFDAFYSKIDCYICASESEGTPNTVFESLACGIPVITTKVGNVKDVVIDGFNGFLVDRNEDSLVKAIQSVVKNKAKFKKNKAEIRESVRHFSWRLKTINWEMFLDHIFDQL
jgi:hypothetical protein